MCFHTALPAATVAAPLITTPLTATVPAAALAATFSSAALATALPAATVATTLTPGIVMAGEVTWSWQR